MKPNAYLLIVSFFSLFFVVCFNVYSSQIVSPLFLDLTRLTTKESAQELLSKLDHTQFFTGQLTYFSEIFGKEIQDSLVEGELNKKRHYEALQDALNKNDSNPQILLKLAVLNYQDGNIERATTFYQKAKAIDPWIKIKELEAIKPNR